MKKFLMALAVLALVSAPAFAGPNAGGTLILHDTGLQYTYDSTSYPSAAPADCETGTDIQVPAGIPAVGWAGYVWKAYAAFPETSSPRLKALPMGEGFPAGVTVLAGGMPDPVMDFEIPQNGWPTTSGGGVGISFGVVKTAIINEVYWFGGYCYYGGDTFAMIPHPTQPMIFVDDEVPPNEDPIAGLSSIGFGVDGTLVCPQGETPGACCLPDETCIFVFMDECTAAGGQFVGGECTPELCVIPDPTGACCVGEVCTITTELECQGEFWYLDVPCEPENPCATPTEETSWGQIKANYR